MAEERKLPFGITSVMPSTAQTIADSKVTGFTIGSQKRTNPFQKHKEEAEMKRRKEAEEAEKVLEEFTASFDVDNSKQNKKFVKGKSTFVPTVSVFGQDEDEEENEAEKEAVAKSKAGQKPPGFVQASTTATTAPAMTVPTKSPGAKTAQEQESTPYIRDAKARRKKEMDDHLEAIKKAQAEREERASNKLSRPAAGEYKMGSRDTGDLSTSNLYVGNLHPQVNEEQLCMEFGIYGPIASVKVMWPRTQEEIDRGCNIGFVNFMERADAAKALREMEGKEILGFPVKLGWSKAAPIPAEPLFVHKDYKAPPKAPKVQVRKSVPPSSTDIIVTKPTDPKTLVIIHRVVEKVLINGADFEDILIEKEFRNPTFAFLINLKSPEHIYYRWRLYSMKQGDTATRWRTEPFKMVEGGPMWVPPLMTFSDEIMEEDQRLLEAHEDEFEKAIIRGTLSRGERGFFEAQLRMITSQRRSIGRAMLFCMQHAEAADEIVEILVEAMILSTTPQQVRMARLYLISDILHNSSIPLPNVWKLRSALEVKLPVMFEGLNVIYRQIDARMKAEQFRRQITGVLGIWENWIVFPQHYIAHLGTLLVRKDVGAGAGETGQQQQMSVDSHTPSTNASTTAGFGRLSTFEAVEAGSNDIDGEPMGDGTNVDEDLDGVPLDEDLDGVPMDDDDLDGVPL
ncbi:U2 snRNP-associated SURP domain-containing protein [Linnemannia schmuckeri]|uniref:U2 snRNP-associated SURP domain-containing protein n=1 Tax=Linnemannia schmuckeri TaxID=64567 RepID=A0A9P5S1S3_9FUNG|nr:U2 snRNP-associated SURP domain-containing protein [Linnemannia schmuckeri]